MPNDDAPIPTQTRAALRAIEARRIARIDPRELTDLALARYARDWAGTVRGDAAVAEITRRGDVLDSSAYAAEPFNALDFPAGYTHCACEGCRDLAERDRATRGKAPVTVRETINHGNYRHDNTQTRPTLREAVAAVLTYSPYGYLNAGTVGIARVTDALLATGHAEFGWSDYDVV